MSSYERSGGGVETDSSLTPSCCLSSFSFVSDLTFDLCKDSNCVLSRRYCLVWHCTSCLNLDQTGAVSFCLFLHVWGGGVSSLDRFDSVMKRQTIKGKTNLRVRSFLVGDELIKVLEKTQKNESAAGSLKPFLLKIVLIKSESQAAAQNHGENKTPALLGR